MDSSSMSTVPKSPNSSSSMLPICSVCGWAPQPRADRSAQSMKQAVQRHIKRNHELDYHCPICNQPFRNRPDNVKPHVARKHPELFASLYPRLAESMSPRNKSLQIRPALDNPNQAGQKKADLDKSTMAHDIGSHIGAVPGALPQRSLATSPYLTTLDAFCFNRLTTDEWPSYGSLSSSDDSGYETIAPGPGFNSYGWGGYPHLPPGDLLLESNPTVPKAPDEESVKEEPRAENLGHFIPILEDVRVCKSDQNDAAVKIEAETEAHSTGTGNEQAIGGGLPYHVETPHTHEASIDGHLSAPTETSTPDSSAFWLAEYSEEEDEKLDKYHPFMRFKTLAAARVFETFCRWKEYRFEQDIPCDGPGKSNAAPIQYKGKGKDSATRKRTWADQSESSKDTTDKSGPSSQTASSKRRRTSDRKLTFACPYTKKDPMSYRDCYKYVLSRIRDVKQHLARCHRNPPYCPRCMGTFETEEERDGHVRGSSCPLRPPVKLDGITESQKRQLAKKSASNTSVEDQWFAVFDILFPGHDPRPRSPYIDSELLQDITLYQDFLTSSGPRILSDVLTRRGAITWNLPNEERDLAAFQQIVFEEGLRAIFDQWVSRRGNGSQEPGGPSGSESVNQDTPPSSSTSFERVVSSSNDASGVPPTNMRFSLSGRGPNDTLAGSEALQEASSGQIPFDGGLDGILNFEHEGVDFQAALDYDGPDEELMRLMLGTHESSSFQPGTG